MFTLARFLPRAVPLLVVVAMMPAPIPAAAWAPPPGDFGLCVEGIALHVHSSYRGTITLITAEKFCDTGTAVTSFGTNGLGSITEDFTSSKTTAGKCA